MARDFSKNTANYLSLGTGTLGALLNALGAVSVHAWLYADTLSTGANDNRSVTVKVSGSSAGVAMFVGGATAKFGIGGRSVVTDGFQSKSATTTFTSGAWHACGGVCDFAGDVVTPYYQGVAEGGGAVTFANPAFTYGAATNHDMIGAADNAPGSTAQQFDGRIAEVAIWTVDIGANGFASLAKGYSPPFVRPDKLIFYADLLGRGSPERDLRSGATGTITGSVPVYAHVPIIYPATGRSRRYATAAAAGTSLNEEYEAVPRARLTEPLVSVW